MCASAIKEFDCGIGDLTPEGITIKELGPLLKAEKSKAEVEKIKLDKVNLSGNKISPKEIYDRYKDRIYIVTSYNSLGKAAYFGTGFLVQDKKIVTN